MWLQGKGEAKGFSVVEMIVVVVIISLLAMMAFNTYKSTVAKARQAEAKANLKQIGDLMDTWQYEHGKYEDKLGVVGAPSATNCTSAKLKNELGYRPKDCHELRYKYDITATGSSTFTAQAYNDPATSGYEHIWPGCTIKDEWSNNQKGQIKAHATNNVLTKCE